MTPKTPKLTGKPIAIKVSVDPSTIGYRIVDIGPGKVESNEVVVNWD